MRKRDGGEQKRASNLFARLHQAAITASELSEQHLALCENGTRTNVAKNFPKLQTSKTLEISSA